MNNEWTHKLEGVIELLIESSSRINEAKPRRYWYPLSLATYGTPEILEVLDSLCSFRTSMGEKTLAFERAFAKYQGCHDGVMVNSGSSADLLLTFLLTDPTKPLLQPGDEVLVPAVTWPTQIWSVLMAGLTPVLVDTDPATMNIDLDDMEAKTGERTRAVFPVHLMGNPCDMDRICALAKNHDLHIIEDCCEALGSEFDGRKVGNFGLGGSFSFFFSHHITTMEGGLISTPDIATTEQLRILRAHGWARNVDLNDRCRPEDGIDPRYAFINWGFNLRPTDVQAGFGSQQLMRLEAFNKRRVELAETFFSFIDGQEFLSRPKTHPKALPVWFALPLLVAEDAPFTREELTGYLESQGIETRPVVAGNVTRHPAARLFKAFDALSLPGADAIHFRAFYVGLSPLSTDEDMQRLIASFQSFLEKY